MSAEAKVKLGRPIEKVSILKMIMLILVMRKMMSAKGKVKLGRSIEKEQSAS